MSYTYIDISLIFFPHYRAGVKAAGARSWPLTSI